MPATDGTRSKNEDEEAGILPNCWRYPLLVKQVHRRSKEQILFSAVRDSVSSPTVAFILKSVADSHRFGAVPKSDRMAANNSVIYWFSALRVERLCKHCLYHRDVHIYKYVQIMACDRRSPRPAIQTTYPTSSISSRKPSVKLVSNANVHKPILSSMHKQSTPRDSCD